MKTAEKGMWFEEYYNRFLSMKHEEVFSVSLKDLLEEMFKDENSGKESL
jgi:hypothetical protein